MGYFHRIGIMPKNEFNRIQKLSKEEFRKFMQNEYGYYSVSSIAKKDNILELFFMGSLKNDIIYKTITEEKTPFGFHDCLNQDEELFVPKQEKFFERLAKAYWNKWLDYLTEYSYQTIGIDAKQEAGLLPKRNTDLEFEEMDIFKMTFERTFSKRYKNPMHEKLMFIKNEQFNYMAINFKQFEEKFDYDNFIIFIYAW